MKNCLLLVVVLGTLSSCGGRNASTSATPTQGASFEEYAPEEPKSDYLWVRSGACKDSPLVENPEKYKCFASSQPIDDPEYVHESERRAALEAKAQFAQYLSERLKVAQDAYFRKVKAKGSGAVQRIEDIFEDGTKSIADEMISGAEIADRYYDKDNKRLWVLVKVDMNAAIEIAKNSFKKLEDEEEAIAVIEEHRNEFWERQKTSTDEKN